MMVRVDPDVRLGYPQHADLRPIHSPMNWPSASRPRPGPTAEARSPASRRPTWRPCCSRPPGWAVSRPLATAGLRRELRLSRCTGRPPGGAVIVDNPEALHGLKLTSCSPAPQRVGPTGRAGGPRRSLTRPGGLRSRSCPSAHLHINVQVPENSTLKFITPRNNSIEAGRLTEVTITEQKPPKTRTLAGRVVDTKGNPVAGATVFQSGDAPARTETTSDAGGRFTLPGVAEASTFVFARAKGFRFAGGGEGRRDRT